MKRLWATFMLVNFVASTPSTAGLFDFGGDRPRDEGSSPLSSSAGRVLLSSFQCDSKADATQRILSSMQQLHSTLASINQSEASCKAAIQGIDLPEIESIMNRMRSDSTLEAVKTQEAIISEALAD